MGVYLETFRNLTAGTVLTAANSGATAVGGLTAATVGGRVVAQAVAPGTGTAVWRRSTPALETVIKAVSSFRHGALPPADRIVLKESFDTTVGANPGLTSFSVIVLLNGKVRVTTVGNGTSTIRGTSTTSLLPDTEYRVEAYADIGTSATTGRLHVVVYPYASSTPVAADLNMLYTSIDLGGTGSTGFVQMIAGKNSSDNATDTINVLPGTGLKTGVDAIDGPEPFGNSAPVVSAGSAQDVAAGATVTLSGTATDPDGSPLTHQWTFDFASGATPTLTGATTLSPSFVAGPVGSVYILRLTSTDGANPTAATTEVRVPVPATSEILPVAFAPTVWTPVGGTTNVVLADSSNTTYLQSPVLTATEAIERIRFQPSASRANGTVTPTLSKSDEGAAVVRMRLYIGLSSVTAIDSWQVSPTSTIADYPRVLPQAAIDAINAAASGWDRLYIEVSAATA